MDQIKKIGPHTITCASIENPIVDLMLQGHGRKVRVLYSDPPWGDGNLKYWATQNRKMTGAVFTPLTYDALVNRILDLTQKYVQGHIFIETGLRWEKMLMDSFAKAGLLNVQSHRMEYASGSKMLVNVAVSASNIPSTPFGQLPDVAAIDYIAEVIRATGAVPGSLVLDPCCGMGYTAAAAIKTGMVFAGNEFNSVRLAKTIKRLEASI